MTTLVEFFFSLPSELLFFHTCILYMLSPLSGLVAESLNFYDNEVLRKPPAVNWSPGKGLGRGENVVNLSRSAIANDRPCIGFIVAFDCYTNTDIIMKLKTSTCSSRCG